MIRIAKPLVLPAIFYQVQGVITVFLVSMFGTSNMVAEVGAFGRLAMVLIVVDRVTEHPAVSRSSRARRRARGCAAILSRAHLVYSA